jgi:hypothetical protein
LTRSLHTLGRQPIAHLLLAPRFGFRSEMTNPSAQCRETLVAETNRPCRAQALLRGPEFAAVDQIVDDRDGALEGGALAFELALFAQQSIGVVAQCFYVGRLFPGGNGIDGP